MKKTALHQKHVDLGAKMVPFAGFEMPVQYTSVNQEHMAVRESVGVFDVSHMGQFFARGENAAKLLQWITSNDVEKVSINQAQYTCMPNEKGGIVDDLIIYKLAEDEFLLVVNAANIQKDWDWILSQNQWDVALEDASDEMSLLAVQGPKAIEAMQSLTDVNLTEIPFYHFVKETFAGQHDVIISATGYTGSGGFELYIPNKSANEVWDKVMAAGKSFDIQPCGLASRDTLRLEKGYCLYGNDINDETTPLEAGLGWITKLNTYFVAKEILAKQKEAGIEQKLVAFKMTERGIPRKDYLIVDENGNEIGKVTSGTQSPMLKCGIGLGYIKKELSKTGTEIFVQIRNKNIAAEVVKLPFV